MKISDFIQENLINFCFEWDFKTMTTTIFIFRSIISHIDSLSVVSLSISCFLLIDISRFLFLFVNVSLFCLCVNIVYFLLLFNEDFSRLSLSLSHLLRNISFLLHVFSLFCLFLHIYVYMKTSSWLLSFVLFFCI